MGACQADEVLDPSSARTSITLSNLGVVQQVRRPWPSRVVGVAVCARPGIGDCGVVVLVHEEGKAHEVEFSTTGCLRVSVR